MKFYGDHLANGQVNQEDVFDKMKNAAGSNRSSDEAEVEGGQPVSLSQAAEIAKAHGSDNSFMAKYAHPVSRPRRVYRRVRILIWPASRSERPRLLLHPQVKRLACQKLPVKSVPVARLTQSAQTDQIHYLCSGRWSYRAPATRTT